MIIKNFESFNAIEDCVEITLAEKDNLLFNRGGINWSENELKRVKKLFKISESELDEFTISNREIRPYPLNIKIVSDSKFCITTSIHKLTDDYYTISYSEENSLEVGKSRGYYKCDQIYGLKSFAKFFISRFNHLKSIDYSSVELYEEPVYTLTQNGKIVD